MSNIIEFLIARIKEDEQAAQDAKYAASGAGPQWGSYMKEVTGPQASTVAATQSSFYAEHIARWDPSRVLAECAVKRAIIAGWSDQEALNGPDLMRVMALAYRYHPDYESAWEI